MKLRDWRAREGLSLEACGERLGLSHATLSRIERGKHYPDRETIQKIFERTDGEVTLHDWFTEDGKPIPQSDDTAPSKDASEKEAAA